MPGDENLTVLVANPAADVYGSDLQMLQSVAAMRTQGWRVVVALPADGPLCPRLNELGAEVVFVDFPVLRRSDANPAGILRMALDATRALPRIRRLIHRLRPSVVYVNTVTLPWWLLGARSTRTPVVCHVHEAEVKDHLLVRKALSAPLQLTTAFIVVSRSALDAICDIRPGLRSRAHLVYNCVSQPSPPPSEAQPGPPWRVLVVGRLSPRKAPHIALEAAALLRQRGRDVELSLCGTGLPIHARYVDALHERAAQPDLVGAVEFAGYSSPVWPALARSHVLLAPSLGESFGLAVVEAQLALRPVVATAVQGHLETVDDGRTGLLVPMGDASALATAVERLMDDPGQLTSRLVHQARAEAAERFSVTGYQRDLLSLLTALTAQSTQQRSAPHHL